MGTIGGLPMNELIQGLLYVIVLLIGAWCKKQEGEIREHKRENEKLRKEVMERWVKDAETFVTKDDFKGLANELKQTLVRIEDKIEKLRG